MTMTKVDVHSRCEAAIRGEAVNRAPTYLPGIACSVASELLGRPVHTGSGSLRFAEACARFSGAAAHAEFVAKLYDDLIAIYRHLGVDVFRMPWREGRTPTQRLAEYRFLFGDPDGAYSICQYDPNSCEYGTVESYDPDPLDFVEQVRQSVAREEAALESDPTLPSLAAEHIAICERFDDEMFAVYSGGGVSVGLSEDDMLLLLTDPDLAARRVMLQARCGVALGRALAASGYPRVLIAGGDLAGNTGPIYSPAVFRRVMLPALQRLMQALIQHDVHYVFRTDGDT